MSTSSWRSYTDLAWTETIVAPPENYVEETTLLCRLIEEHSVIDVRTLLHLGSGAGINDYTFKRYFDVTGVDISNGMLEIATEINPEVTYLLDDMRTVRLGKLFDSVVIPEALAYMRTREDLHKAIFTADEHLKPGGVLLITAHVKEQFRENNFVYTGSKNGIEITVFENNYIPDPAKEGYEATIIYLIRRNSKLEIHTDVHKLGLFKLETWKEVLKGFNFTVKKVQTDHLYEPFIMGEGEYPLVNFICLKRA